MINDCLRNNPLTFSDAEKQCESCTLWRSVIAPGKGVFSAKSLNYGSLRFKY